MRRILALFLCVGLLAGLCACGNTTPANDKQETTMPTLKTWTIDGYFHDTDNGTMIIREYMLDDTDETTVTYEPIIIKNAEDFDLSALENSDAIRLTIDRIEESYPAKTNMYSFELLETQSSGYENCKDVIDKLNEMGYVSVQTIEEPIKKPDINNGMDSMTENNVQLGLDILREAMKQDYEKNVLISPLSLYEDLSLMTYGADGETLSELTDNIFHEDIETVGKNVRHFNSAVIPDSIHVANSIWFNKQMPTELNQGFTESAKKLFNAEIQNIAYDQSGVDIINAWVNKCTCEMIPSIVTELSEDEIMHLINALAFESEWLIPYQDIDVFENATFESIKGDTIKEQNVNMLISHDEMYTTLTNDDDKMIAQAFRKPYKDGKTAFIGIRPCDDYTPEDVINLLDGKKFTELCDSFIVAPDMTAGIPEYSLDYSLDMTNILKDLGMKKSFTQEAEFSKMLDNTPLDMAVYVGGVLQKTHIEVDRKGTKAAAVTDISMKVNAVSVEPPVRVILDKPFVYAIIDIETGMPYFIGIQYSCAESE